MNLPPKIVAIASDHAGPRLKSVLKQELKILGCEVIDFGTEGGESVDYPDYSHKVALAVTSGEAEMGLLICGSGIGVSIVANRYDAVRAALCHSEETTRLSRQHNNANILCLGARIINEESAKDCVRTFFTTPFEGGRHQGRIDKFKPRQS